MALKKTITSRSGFELSYWKIVSWRIDLPRKMVDITLIPFVSSETREEGLEPVNEERRQIKVYDRINNTHPEKSTYNYSENFSPEALEKAGVDIYKLMYEYIKNHVTEFSDAQDI